MLLLRVGDVVFDLVFVPELPPVLVFMRVLEFMLVFEFILPELPVFAFRVGTGVGVEVMDELFVMVFEFTFRAFVFVLLSAPHPSSPAETIKPMAVARIFLILFFVLSSLITN